MAEKEKNSLAGWSGVIRDSAKQAREQRKEWQDHMGEPKETLEIDSCKFGFWKSKCPDGVIVVPITKNGADPTRMQTYEREFIEKLVKVMKEEDIKINPDDLVDLHLLDDLIEEDEKTLTLKEQEEYDTALSAELTKMEAALRKEREAENTDSDGNLLDSHRK